MKLSYVVATPEVTTPRLPAAVGSFDETLPLLAELGYEGVELSACDPAALDPDAIEAKVRGLGLAVSAVHTAGIGFQDGLHLCDPDEGVRTEALARLRASVDLAARLGAAGVVVGSFRGRLLEGEGRERSLGWMRGAYLAGADYAAKRGARVLFEPEHRFNTRFGRSAGEALGILREWNHEGLGLILDTFHMNIEDASFAGSIFEARSMLAHMHIADSNRLYPGAGHVPFGEVVSALRAIGYEGYLSVQINQRPGTPVAAARAFQHLKSLL